MEFWRYLIVVNPDGKVFMSIDGGPWVCLA